jgi:flagellar biosynthesis GTPase FlhF
VSAQAERARKPSHQRRPQADASRTPSHDRARLASDPALLTALVEAGSRGPAGPLPPHLRDALGTRFGIDLSGVRVHESPEANDAAAALGARAFTFGRDIVLGSAADPGTLAHEAFHAAQFARHGGPPAPSGIAAPSHPAHREAQGGAGPDGTGPSASAAGLVQPQLLEEEKKPAATTTTTTTTTTPAAQALGAMGALSTGGKFLAQIEHTEAFKATYEGMPAELKLGVFVGNLEAGFMAAFVPALIASVTQEDQKQLQEEFSSVANNLKFSGGMYVGIPVGIVKDIWSNVQGLWELVKLGYEYAGPGVNEKIIREAAEYGANPEAYKKKKAAEAEYAKQVAINLTAFFMRVRSDPAVLIGTGESFGLAAADYASQWFHGDFMKQSAFWQGETIGSAIGMVATEIALLFLGPEEWVARGAAAIGRGAKAAAEATKIGRYIIEILEKAPEILKIFEAGKALKAAEEAAEASRAASKVEKGAEEASKVGKAAEALGEVHPHGPGELPHEAPKLPEKPPEKAPAKPLEEVPPEKKPAAKTEAEPKPKEEAKPKTEAEPKPKEEAKPKTEAEPKPKEEAKPKEKPETEKPKEKPEPKEKAEQDKAAKQKAKEEKAKAKEKAKEEAAAKKARQKEAQKALEDLHQKKPARGSAGQSWDYEKFPEGPGRRWKAGDPPNMPDSKGTYPGWDTIRERYWKNLAHNELEARKAGAAMEVDKELRLNPQSWTDAELNEMLKTGKGPKGFEIEHKDIPQRVVTMLEEAGFPQNDARRIGQLGDPQNLSPELREFHAVVDKEAASFRDRNPTLPASLDERTENPLRSMTADELENLIAEIKKKGIDLGKTDAGRQLRQELTKEAAAWNRKWDIP